MTNAPCHDVPVSLEIAAQELRKPAERLDFLDSLRGLAILLVIVVHSCGSARTYNTSLTLRLAMMGQRGVELFYMVSAFTLFLSLDHVRPGPRPLLSFYLRRFFRIAPAFYVALLAEVLLYGLWHPHFGRYPLALLFLNGWFPDAINLSIIGSWSIAVETTFYLFVPWLHRKIRTVRAALVWVFATALIFTPLSYILALYMHHAEYFELMWFPVQIPVFMLGVLAYQLWKAHLPQRTDGDPGFWTTDRRQTYALLLLALAVTLFFANIEFELPRVFFNLRLLPTSSSFVLLILSGALWPSPPLFNRFTAFIGKISYSMYLCHFFLLWTYLRLVPDPPSYLLKTRGTFLLFIAFTAASIPISYLMWRLVEQPGILLGRRVLQHLNHRATLPPITLADRAGL